MSRTRFLTIPCPGCGTFYAIAEYLSINFTEWRKWPDGWGYGPLYQLSTRLRGCPCGTLFWPDGRSFKTREFDLSDITEPDLTPEPEDEPEPSGWFARLLYRKRKPDSLQQILRQIRAQRPTLPIIHSAKVAGLYRVLLDSDVALDDETELEIRKWLWWTWNHPQRDLGFIPGDAGPDASEEVKGYNFIKMNNLKSM
jgi:hypothetical protein